MSRTPFTSILLALSILTTLATAFSIPLYPRQQQPTLATLPDCAHYSTIANLSTVGANATYRSAYLAASPLGSDPARAPLDAAIPLLPALKFNKTLNEECGNLSTIATEAAATNFTQGIVLQFKIGVVNSAVQTGASALGMAVVMALVVGMVGNLI
jgi:hypothetical protein